ncbi:MAG: zinc-binding dehydrogenase, partial [Pseudomonadota bacterium]
EKLGATPINYKIETVTDYVKKYTDGVGFDIIYDSVGGANIANSFEAAALNGNIATTVSMAELDLSAAHFKGLSLHVVFMLIPMLHNHKREEHHVILNELTHIVDAGGLKPVLDTQDFDLADISKAHDRLMSGQAMGKIVVTV